MGISLWLQLPTKFISSYSFSVNLLKSKNFLDKQCTEFTIRTMQCDGNT